MKRLLLVVCMLLVGLLLVAGCGGGPTSEAAAIEDTIRGYVTTYNAEDFDKCLTYFTDYEDKEDALAFLSFARGLSGPLELREINDIAIVPVAVPGGSRTATATVIFTITGEESTDQIRLKEVDGHWKIIWEQEQEATTGESAAIEETIRDYFAAYNAEDFVRCLTYFTDFGDEQAARASLSLMRDFIGEMTLHEVGYITVFDQTATARVDFVFWWAKDSQEMQFQKENGAWKMVWGQEPTQPLRPLAPLPVPAQRYISGTVELAPEFQEVVQVKYCLLLQDEGEQTRFWERLQVMNIGDQPLELRVIAELYKVTEELWGSSSFTWNLMPGQAVGTPGGYSWHPTEEAPASYKVIVKNE
jgi:ketosteroid isomerase-like protein